MCEDCVESFAVPHGPRPVIDWTDRAQTITMMVESKG